MTETFEPGMRVPYPSFVADLFVKPETVEGRLAHAAVGIIGELLELRAASDRAKALEELGDLMFYIEAARQQLAWDGRPNGVNHFPSSQQAAQWIAEAGAGALLDFSKKAWIYGEPLEEIRGQCCLCLNNVEYCLKIVADHLGFLPAQIEQGNRRKLLKRYQGGKYSDAAAQARADKAPGLDINDPKLAEHPTAMENAASWNLGRKP